MRTCWVNRVGSFISSVKSLWLYCLRLTKKILPPEESVAAMSSIIGLTSGCQVTLSLYKS